MRLSDRLIVSDPARESEWRQIIERRLKKPVLYVICVPRAHSYPAEILPSQEFYKTEEQQMAIGLADSYSAALGLIKKAVEDALLTDPKLKNLKADFRERYI